MKSSRIALAVAAAAALVSACSGTENRPGDGGSDKLGDGGSDTPSSGTDSKAAETLDSPGPGEAGDGDANVGIPGTIVVDAGGGGRVEVTLSPLSIRGFRGEELVWNGSDSPLLSGAVVEYDPALRYDPELVLDEVEWTGAEDPVEYELAADGMHEVVFEPVPGRKMVLSFKSTAEGVVSFDFGPRKRDGEVLCALSYSPLDDKENFYGLGESFDQVARRGTHRHMHIAPDLTQESGYNEAHFPIPLLVSTAGSGVFVENRHPGYFDVCETNPDRVQVRFSTHQIRFHVLIAATPLDVVGRYASVAGMPALPPRWAFGILQWRNEVSGQAMVMEDALAMREHDLPCSAIWIDRPFATAHESFVFDPAKFPDSKQMIEDLNSLGYRVAIWTAPYLNEELKEEYALAEANAYFVESPDIQFDKFGRLMDFTDPGAVTLWQSLIANATGIGIEGFKLDYGEDVISGWMTLKTVFEFYNGEGSDTMHHWYHYFYHKTYRDMLGDEPFLLSRAGCYGDQSVTTVCWPGDLDADFHYHGEDGFVGGLPAAIIGMQTLSASGYPFFGSDTGGFRHFRPTKEVLLRWVQHTALSTTLQFGGAGVNTNPWDFTHYEGDSDGVHYVSQFDEQTLEVWRTFARLHIRLFPYLYTYAVHASTTGVPVIRPFGMAFPMEGKHPDFEYMVGDWLLVAPVYREDGARKVSIPEGTWFDWFDSTAYEGPADLDVEVPLDRLILLAREGAIIPMLRETVDTLSPANDPDVDSFAEKGGKLVVKVFPGEQGGAFDSVPGPKIKLKSMAGGYEISFEALFPAFDSIRLEVNLSEVDGGPFDSPVVTSLDGKPLKAVPSAQDALNCSGCYHHDPLSGQLFASPAPTAEGGIRILAESP